jgi:hypothetical protein
MTKNPTPRIIVKAKKLYWLRGLSFADVAEILLGNRNAQMRIRRWIGPGEKNRRGWNASKTKDSHLKKRAIELRLVRSLSLRKVAKKLGCCPRTVMALTGKPSPQKPRRKEH